MLLTTTKVLYSVLSQNGFFCNYFVFIFVDFLHLLKERNGTHLRKFCSGFFRNASVLGSTKSNFQLYSTCSPWTWSMAQCCLITQLQKSYKEGQSSVLQQFDWLAGRELCFFLANINKLDPVSLLPSLDDYNMHCFIFYKYYSSLQKVFAATPGWLIANKNADFENCIKPSTDLFWVFARFLELLLTDTSTANLNRTLIRMLYLYWSPFIIFTYIRFIQYLLIWKVCTWLFMVVMVWVIDELKRAISPNDVCKFYIKAAKLFWFI